jgi:hypothetical protein
MLTSRNWTIYSEKAGPPDTLGETGASTHIKLALRTNWSELEHLLRKSRASKQSGQNWSIYLDKAGSSGKLFTTGATTRIKLDLQQNRMRTWWRAGYIPGDRRTSWVYSTTFVQYLYISCYLTDNKPVLSYHLLGLRPQDIPS